MTHLAQMPFILSEDRRKIILPILVGLFFLVFFALGIGYYVRWSKEIWEKDKRVDIMKDLVALRSSLENELYSRIYYTRSVAAYVSLRPDMDVGEFFNLADELVGVDDVVHSMALSPDGVIAAVYPAEGTEEAIGLDLLEHPERRKIVEQTIRTGKTFVAGPVELVEGGIAFISYTPVFDKTGEEPYDFWGVADIVILKEGLLEAANLERSVNGTELALRGIDGRGADGDIFFGNAEVFDSDPVEVTIYLPDGEWVLGGIPEGGWSTYLDQDRTMVYLMVGGAVVIAALLAFLSGLFLKLKASRKQLQRLNMDKDRLLSVIAHDLRSPISAITSLSSELMQPGELQISHEQSEIIHMINQSADEGLLLLENLLSWVRSREEGSLMFFEKVDLFASCQRIADLFAAPAHFKSIQIVNQVHSPTEVQFDQRVLETVLRNLLSNAVKFSAPGGRIEISAIAREDGKTELRVKDEGEGMSRSRISEVLAPEGPKAFQVESTKDGAGIGLLLCRDLLRQTGEDLKIESEEGAGTLVSFTLSAVSGKSEGE